MLYIVGNRHIVVMYVCMVFPRRGMTNAIAVNYYINSMFSLVVHGQDDDVKLLYFAIFRIVGNLCECLM